MKNLLPTNPLIPTTLMVAALLLMPGCGRKSGDSTETTTPATTARPAPAIQSAEKTSFNEVTAHLDPGGNLYGYLGTRQWLEGLSGRFDGWRDAITSLPEMSADQREKAGRALDLVGSLIRNSGLEQISGVGVSGIALEPGYYQTKLMIHHYPGAEQGYLWRMGGAAPRPLEELNLLPADTAWAAFGDFNPMVCWNALKQEVNNAGLPEAVEGLNKIETAIEQATGSNLSTLLGSLGGSQGILLTLDSARNIQLPLPEAEGVQIPEPALLIAVKVKDDTLFDLIDSRLKQMPQVVSSNANGLRTRTMSVPLPVPVNLKPTVARYADYLFIASSDELVRKVVAVHSGEAPGLKSSSEFQRLSKGMPEKGNQFNFVSERLGKTVRDVQRTAMGMASQSGKAGEVPVKLMEKLYSVGTVVSSYNVGSHTDEGWLMIGHGNQEPAKMVVAPMVVVPVAVGAGVLLPALAKAKEKAQSIQCVNNLKQIALASLMWASDHDNVIPPDFLSMKEELSSPGILFCPGDKSVSSPKSITWDSLDTNNISYEFVSPGMSLAIRETMNSVLVRCPIHGHQAMADGSVVQSR